MGKPFDITAEGLSEFVKTHHRVYAAANGKALLIRAHDGKYIVRNTKTGEQSEFGTRHAAVGAYNMLHAK